MNPPSKDSAAPEPSSENLAFVGQVTASVTHELSNVLGTIEQVVGIVEDMTDLDESLAPETRERLRSVVERIAKQSDRGAGLIRRLNRFAHLNDVAFGECNVGELVGNVVALAERAAGLRKVELTSTGLDQSVVLTTSPLQLAQVVYGSILRALSVADRSAPLEVAMEPRDHGCTLVFEAARKPDGEPEDSVLDPLSLAAQLGWNVDEQNGGERYRLTLTTGEK